MRKLITRRFISSISDIINADFIERITIDGWHCVAKKGEFKEGDQCYYFEIDSFLPESDSRFEFLMKSGVRLFEDSTGHRLRTVKLRNQISQGLALPTSMFPELSELTNDDDMAEAVGVKKWEAPVPACIAGEVEGIFPSFIPVTDEERVQNIIDQVFDLNRESMFEVSLKLDGTSMTVFYCDWFKRKVGVCMRNFELKMNENNAQNTLINMAKRGLLDKLMQLKVNVAIQGELMGESIQKNREKFKGHRFYVFNIYLIDKKRQMTPDERMKFFKDNLDGLDGIYHVPTLENKMSIKSFSNVNDILHFAEGESINNPVREGYVWKRIDGMFSFKTINNKFLLKEE